MNSSIIFIKIKTKTIKKKIKSLAQNCTSLLYMMVYKSFIHVDVQDLFKNPEEEIIFEDNVNTTYESLD